MPFVPFPFRSCLRPFPSIRLSHLALAAVIVLLAMLSGAATRGADLFTDSGQSLLSPPAANGNWSHDVALGDVDGDGDIDALVAQGGGGSPQGNVIWLNNGAGVFSASSNLVGAGDSQAVVLADFDGDADLDAWIANANGSDEVYTNNGAGVFTLVQTIPGDGTIDVAAGDMDGDGDVDVVVVGFGLRVWLNTNGQFVAGPVEFNTSQNTVALADLDGDEDLDIVTGGEGTFLPNQVWWNDLTGANGGLQPGPTLVMDGIANSIGIAHLDDVSGPDILIATSGANQVWWNNGDRTFTAGDRFGTESDTDVALGDLDGDGTIDAFMARRTVGSTLQPNGYWLNDGARGFTLSPQELGTAETAFSNSFAVGLGNLDGVGGPDVFIANSGPNEVYLNIGAASGPVLTLDPLPARPLAETAALDWWQRGNGIVCLQLNAPHSTDIVIRTRASFAGPVFPIPDPLTQIPASVDTVTLPAGETSVALEAFVGQPGGHASELWNPYAGTDLIFASQAGYTIEITVLTPGVSLPGPSTFYLNFYNRDYELRNCFLGGFLLLMGYTEEDILGWVLGAEESNRPRGSRVMALARHVAEALMPPDLDRFRRLRDEILLTSPAGEYYTDLYYRFSPALLQVVTQNPTLLMQINNGIDQWTPAIQALLNGNGDSVTITAAMVADAQQFLTAVRDLTTDDDLRALIDAERAALDLSTWTGMTMDDLLTRVESQTRPTPTITTQPATQSVVAGGSVTLSVIADGAGPLSYQWFRDGAAVSGATDATYELPSAQDFHAGAYTVVVTNPFGDETSASAGVTVSAPSASTARLLNLSTRGQALTGSDVLIPGFVISGTENKRLLIRAVGPTLAHPPFNLATPLDNPRMSLKRLDASTNPATYVDVTSNDDWMANANAAAITQTAADLFAFPLQDDHEAALLVDLAPGQYTVVADGVANATGVAIVELYDADAATVDARLVNISTRGFAGTGDNVMIPGFVVSSEGPKTLLIRVVGPTLASAPYNVPGTMVDPKLEIFPAGSNTPILAQDNWGDNPDAANTAQTAINVSAFALTPGSADAAFVVTLQPGTYTVVGSSADGTGTGVVLVEVYVVP